MTKRSFDFANENVFGFDRQGATKIARFSEPEVVFTTGLRLLNSQNLDTNCNQTKPTTQKTWRQTKLPWGSSKPPHDSPQPSNFLGREDSFGQGKACFFCENVVSNELASVCRSCQSVFCPSCVIKDYERDGCFAYCHSCFCERQRRNCHPLM